MKKQLFAIGIALLVAGCARQPEYEYKFTLNGETHLTFNFTNVKTPKTFNFFYNQSFPLDQFKKTFRVESDTTFEYTLSLNHPAEAICYYDNMEFNIFLVQDEPLTVNLDLANSDVSFEGFTKQICDHLTNNPTWLSEDFENDESCFAKIDSRYADKQKSLDSAYSAGLLPKWFRDYQTENLSFNQVVLKQSYAQFGLNNIDILRKNEPIRESKYYWTKMRLPLAISIVPLESSVTLFTLPPLKTSRVPRPSTVTDATLPSLTAMPASLVSNLTSPPFSIIFSRMLLTIPGSISVPR